MAFDRFIGGAGTVLAGLGLAAGAMVLFTVGTRAQDGADPRLATAEAFIDAFYSFDGPRLHAAMADAPGSQPDILYYQGWAEGGNYLVVTRTPCRFDKADDASCDVTVKDDLVPALGTGFDVTDTFHFAFSGDRIVKVWNSSNDPPEYRQAMDWLRRERPQIFEGPCQGLFAGGPTPHECVRTIAAGFAEFTALGRPVP